MTKEMLVRTYDNDGNDADEVSRTEAESKGLIIANVMVVVFNSKNHVWIQLRSHSKSTHPGAWDVTAGGCVDAGETTMQAAVRELAEESGISGLKLKSAGRQRQEFTENGGTVVRLPEIFYARSDAIPQISDGEAVGFAAYPINALHRVFETSPELGVPSLLKEVDFAFEALLKEEKL